MPQTIVGWWHHSQTAKAPVDLRIGGGFPIYVDVGVDGFAISLLYCFASEIIFS